MLHELQKVVNLFFFFIFFVFFLVTRIMCIEMLHLFQKVPIYLHNPKKNSLFFNNYQVSLFFLFFCLKKMNLKKQQNIHTKYKQYYYTFLHKVLYSKWCQVPNEITGYGHRNGWYWQNYCYCSRSNQGSLLNNEYSNAFLFLFLT